MPKLLRRSTKRNLGGKGMGTESSKELSHEELDELKRSTKFKPEEIKQWYDKFHQDFPDGVIREHEFITMYSKMFPKGDARKFASHVFRAYDADGNGEIDFQEFMTTLSVASRGSTDEKLRWAFRMYDLDGNGTVSRHEATEMILAIYKMRGDFNRQKAEDAAEQIFRCLDKNKDGELSEEEFITGAKSSKVIMEILQAQ